MESSVLQRMSRRCGLCSGPHRSSSSRASGPRAFDFDAQHNLLVSVPGGTYNDLIGKISVSNSAGVSDPSAVDFNYLGHGHPILATQVGNTRFLHRPAGVAVRNGEVLISSGV